MQAGHHGPASAGMILTVMAAESIGPPPNEMVAWLQALGWVAGIVAAVLIAAKEIAGFRARAKKEGEAYVEKPYLLEKLNAIDKRHDTLEAVVKENHKDMEETIENLTHEQRDNLQNLQARVERLTVAVEYMEGGKHSGGGGGRS